MRRDGTIISVEGETVVLTSVVRTCAGCSGAHCSVRTRRVSARAPERLQLNPGDRVEYELSLPRAMLLALLFFGALPLLFVAGFLLLRGVVPEAAEPLAAAAGFAVVALGLFALYRGAGHPGARRRDEGVVRRYSELPRIVRKLPASGSDTDE